MPVQTHILGFWVVETLMHAMQFLLRFQDPSFVMDTAMWFVVSDKVSKGLLREWEETPAARPSKHVATLKYENNTQETRASPGFPVEKF
jgi:hypothetical protein